MNAPLFLVRHGETDWNREGRLQGQRDIPLNPRGERQAARNASVLAGLDLPLAGMTLVASPLARARHTMELVLGRCGDDLRFDVEPRLAELTFGDWEGLTLDEVSASQPEACAAREADKWGYRPPSGESYEDLAERVWDWARDLERPTLAVAHGGVMRALCRLRAGFTPHEAAHSATPQDRISLFRNNSVTFL